MRHTHLHKCTCCAWCCAALRSGANINIKFERTIPMLEAYKTSQALISHNTAQHSLLSSRHHHRASCVVRGCVVHMRLVRWLAG